MAPIDSETLLHGEPWAAVGPFDMVVVGAGLAGVTAAARASEAGLSVLLLEQGETTDYACNSRYSGGIFHVAYTDMLASPESLRAAIAHATGGECDPGQADAISRNAGRAIAWLRDRGTDFVRASATEWHRWTVAPPRPLRPGLSFPGRGLDPLLRRLIELMQSKGGILALGQRVVELGRADDGAFNVTVRRRDGTTHPIKAAAVVLADGGFQGDPEMVRRHISARPDLLVQRGAGTGRGDAARMATALGASLSRMDRFYGHLLARDALANPELSPYPQLDAVAAAGIVVDPAGRRFADESRGGVYLANVIAARPDPSDTMAILDSEIWETAGRSSLYPANPHAEANGGTVHRAATIGALAKLAGLPAEALEESIARYNAAVRGQASDPHPPRRTAGKPIVTPPFLAIPLAVGITHTMGGLLVDEQMRVIGTDGHPMHGLYAAGGSTGGLEGAETVGYVGGLVKACVMGLLAAEHVAALASDRHKGPISAPAQVETRAAESGARRFPFLKLTVRYGALAALPIAVLAGALVGLMLVALEPALRWVAFALGSVVVYVALRACVDLATLIDDMLLPKD